MIDINETQNLTIGEILRYNLEERKGSRFNACGIGSDGNPINIAVVKIDEYEFKSYSAFSFLYEKTYIKSPERSADGSITNLNSYATFVTPHLKIDFSLLSIDDYRVLMKMIYARNEFIVTCYDIVNNKMATHKMYFTTEEMPKLWTIARSLNGEDWVELLGVEDYSVEMVGTNASLEIANILYYGENGELLYSQEVEKGTDALINYEYTATAGNRFDGVWETRNDSNAPYPNGSSVYVSFDLDRLDLYPKVVPTNQYKLSLNFGIGIKPQPQNSNDRVDEFAITKGQTIGTAIYSAGIVLANGSTFAFPSAGTGVEEVEYAGKKYNPYFFDGWGWTPQKSGSSVLSFTEYNYDGNRTIYQYYGVNQYSLSFDTKDVSLSLSTVWAKYNEKVTLPTLYSGNKKTVGWYWLNDGVETAFNGIMPPFNITIYAKWE